MKIIECVPNCSEGRRKDVCDRIAGAVRTVPGVHFLDLQMDKDHNRSVFTFVGTPEGLAEAAFQVARLAVELIDLNQHKGEHPRMGAVDVIPFVPIQDATLEECVALARQVGKRIGESLSLPVYLYEAAGTRPDRRNLTDVRKGQFEGLREEIGRNPDRVPDFGPNTIHPTAGAVAVGARMPLIAYNVDLESKDVGLAKAIAKKIRERDGGLPAVKALGMWVEERGVAQVSMNLVDYTRTSMATVYRAIESEAGRKNVTIRSSEIVGMVPRAAFQDPWIHDLRLTTFRPDQIIENKVLKTP